MNGKELKVTEYNLSFGTTTRKVNVFGLFRYKPNNNLYVIYKDVNTTYNIVYYGDSHIKGNSILSLTCNKDKDEEIIKEYIFKVTEKEDLKNFEIISLDDIEEIEIISSSKLELKKEVLDSLIDLTIPKRKIESEEIKSNSKNKFSVLKVLLYLIIIIVFVMLSSYYYINGLNSTKETVNKTITCTKSYEHSELDNVEVDEEQIFNFNNNDILENVNITTTYNFSDEDDYLSFIQEGKYYLYMPDSDVSGGTRQDDTNHKFIMIEQDRVDDDYNKPIYYEEVLSYYKSEDFSCVEDNLEKK
jgi:uncharacterized protein (UPF0333 family)